MVTWNTDILFSSADNALAKCQATDTSPDTISYLQKHNIILLQELGHPEAVNTLCNLFSDYNLLHTSAPRKGYGVAMLIHKDISISFRRCYDDYQIIHATIKSPGRSVHLLSCYLPYKGRNQLNQKDLPDRVGFLQQLIDDIQASRPDDLIIAAGDFNAHIGTQQALSAAALMSILDYNSTHGTSRPISTTRSQRCCKLDSNGTALNNLCLATDTINLTGLTHGDTPAAHSYESISNSAISRLDHFIVSRTLLTVLPFPQST